MPNNCDQPQKHILVNAESKPCATLRTVLPERGSTSEQGREGGEGLTGREDGWEEEEVQGEP